jgi:CRISPR type III-B/RAMP module RAMP protein Cmr6
LADQFQVPEAGLPSLGQLLAEGTDKERQNLCGRLGLKGGFAAWQQGADDFYRVFGTTVTRGQVVFFDAYPMMVPKLKLDVLNPHYGDYYQSAAKSVPPAAHLNPVPTYFLTVDRGSRFRFAVASKDPALAARAEGWLKSALTELGIGGKTAAGYGFFGP